MSGSEDFQEPPSKKLKSEPLDEAALTSELSMATSINSGVTESPSLFSSLSGPVMTPANVTMYPPKPVIPETSGYIRPSLHINNTVAQSESQLKLTSTDANSSRSQLNLNSTTIAIQQNWTSDGKVTLKFHPSVGMISQPKSPVTFGNVIVSNIGTRHTTPQLVTIQNNRLTSPTSMLSKPVVSADLKGQFPVFSKQGSSNDSVKMGQSTQISFQVPANWNMAGSKSLLDSSGKMSVVAFNSAEGKSLLTDRKSVSNDTSASLGVTDSQSVVNVMKTENLPKTIVTGSGGKVIATLPGQILTSTGLITVPQNTGAINTSSIPQKITKQGSFVISNKQYTIVPANSSQLLKTDNKSNKTKVTMAQIMLPSGPAKIPINQQQLRSSITESGSKQILITAPLMKSGSLPVGKSVITSKPGVISNSPHTIVQVPKMAAMNNNLVPTAKVVEVITSGKSVIDSNVKSVEISPTRSGGTGNGSKPVTMLKTSVLPVQKNWEIVKQSSQLLPSAKMEKTTSSVPTESKTESTQASPQLEKTSEVRTPIKKGQSILSSDNIKKEVVVTEDAQKNTEQGSKKTEQSSEVELGNDKVTLDKPDETKSSENKNNIGVEDLSEFKEEKMEIDSSLTENTVETETKDSELKMEEDFNPVDALDWKDGIGELPGSNLKFHVNDLGVLDVIGHDLECNETLNTSNESETAEPEKGLTVNTDEVAVKKGPVQEVPAVKQDITEPSQQEVSNKDEITQCENCGEYGFATDFYKQGRFCSQTCVGAFDSKRMRGVKKHGTMSKVVLGLKKGRKKILLKDSLNRDKDHPDLSTGVTKKSKAFVWTRYLEKENATEAPARLFKNPFPSTKNNFRVGMKLEGIDPNHQSLFCVLSVVEVCGYRIRLHFDGYSECFDFWSDIDSAYIFPVGFCEKNNKILQPPKGFAVEDFSWTSYLKLTKGTPAPKSIFSNQPVQPVTPNLFRVGSKLEAVDKKNSSLICVASVADTLGDKVLIHFDSWEDNYDFWCDMTAPFIHPCGFCEDKGYVLSPPRDWKDPKEFSWERYLSKVKSQAVPARAFKSRPMVNFEPGMKVEVVDKRNPILVRVASIMEVENYLVKIHFDGWSAIYDYWLDDDSQDIHPPGWCAKTGHPLVPPISPADLVVNSGPGVCPTPGCKGIGHIKGPKYSGHHSTFGCPYSEINMNKETILGDRLVSYIKSEDGMGSTYRMDEYLDKKHQGHSDVSHHQAKSASPQKLLGYGKLNTQENGVPPKKFGRGRKPKSYYLELEEQRRAKEREEERQEKEETLRQGIHNSVFSSAMVPTPKTEVPLCWDQHSKLLPGVTNIKGNDVGKWTIDQVANFVNTLPGCEEQAKYFQEQQIDGEAFLLLTQADIVKIMNIKLGPALKIFNSIIMFKNSIEV